MMVRARWRRGFSLLELMIVLAIILVVAAIAIPNFVNVIANVKLRSGMGSLGGVLQNGRMVAIKSNRTMTVHFTVMANGPVAFVKDPTAASQALATTDPQAQLGAPVTKVPPPTGAGAPSSLLDAALLGFDPDTDHEASFNPRGLPCVYVGPNCTTNVGFAFYFTGTRAFGSVGYAAVTVSPAGRVKTWIWDGTKWGD